MLHCKFPLSARAARPRRDVRMGGFFCLFGFLFDFFLFCGLLSCRRLDGAVDGFA